MKRKTKKIAFAISLSTSFILVCIGFLGLADLIQWVVNFPDAFTYWTFNNRIWLMLMGSIGMIAAVYLNAKEKFIRKWKILALVSIYLGFFMGGFIAPTYLMFRSEHQKAEFLTIKQIDDKYLIPEDEVIVLVINGDARAYPNKWIVQPHIAGDVVGGEDVVMTYCGLSHVGQAYKSKVDGQSLDLKVMTQLKNNLVMFDNNSKEPIPQVYGCMVNTNRILDALPSIVMPFASFKSLYPKGKVYYYRHNNFFDKLVYKMLNMAIYQDGGQYDMETQDLSFPSIKYEDNRLHAKEQMYGVSVQGKPYAFTKKYLEKNGDVAIEVIGSDTITVKYFSQFDFVNIYKGNVVQVNPLGYLGDEKVEEMPHFNRILWKVWANFYQNTEVRM